MAERLSGPGTRSKNPQRYDAIRREMEKAGRVFPRANGDGRGPQLSKRKARLEARINSFMAGGPKVSLGDGYRKPGSMK